MLWHRRIIDQLKEPRTQRWLVATGLVGVAHDLILTSLAPTARLNTYRAQAERPVVPIYIQITPRSRMPTQPPTPTRAGAASSRLPPIAVRQARRSAHPAEVAPLVVDTPPPGVRTRSPGRVIPQSWRERCELGSGEVTEADYQACRDSFLRASTPRQPPTPRTDPRDGWAARSAANVARYEYYRSPAPTGSGNAAPSSTPGSNFGMGEIDRSVVYATGERPVVNGGID